MDNRNSSVARVPRYQLSSVAVSTGVVSSCVFVSRFEELIGHCWRHPLSRLLGLYLGEDLRDSAAVVLRPKPTRCCQKPRGGPVQNPGPQETVFYHLLTTVVLHYTCTRFIRHTYHHVAESDVRGSGGCASPNPDQESIPDFWKGRYHMVCDCCSCRGAVCPRRQAGDHDIMRANAAQYVAILVIMRDGELGVCLVQDSHGCFLLNGNGTDPPYCIIAVSKVLQARRHLHR